MLKHAQQSRLESIIDHQLQSIDEKKVVSEWPERKKIAEFICRPAAFNELKKAYPDIEKLFLVEGNDGMSLSMESSNRLRGQGSFRAGMDWFNFKFECLISDSVSASAFHYQVIK